MVSPTTSTKAPPTTTAPALPTTTTTAPSTTTTTAPPTTTTTTPPTTTTIPPPTTTTKPLPTTSTTAPPTTTIKPPPTTTIKPPPTTTTTHPPTTTTKPPSTTSTTAPPTSTTTAPPTTSTTTPTRTSTTAAPTTTSTTTASCSVNRAYCSDCGLANISVLNSRIVGGAPASADEFPYQVRVFASTVNYTLGCGGSIIKKKWILTAAHCFFDNDNNQALQNSVEIAYGNIDLQSTIRIQAKGYIPHKDYNRTALSDDIALVELYNELNFESDPSIQPICLAEETDISFGSMAVVAGWGHTMYNGSGSNILLEVALQVIPTTQCQTKIYLPPNNTQVVCTQGFSTSTCQGDSGGALVVRVCPNKWVQIGLVSYGDRCEGSTVYTKVSAYRTWIDDNTGSSTTC